MLTVVMMIPMASMLMVAGDLLSEKRVRVSMPYVLTAAIEESGSTVGIADSHIWELTTPTGAPDFAAMDEHLDAMQQLGVNTVRVIIPWRGNEPFGPPGTMPSPIEQSYWARSDYIINRAAERGMAVLGVLNHAPEWGGNFPEPWATIGLEEAPDPDLYAQYAARVVQRYGDKVGAYEIWNEPNSVTGWAPNVDAALYTEVLKAAYTAIKNVNGEDPNDPLVVAGVLGAVVTSPFTLDPRTFVATMYQNGAQGFFDALSFHPYHYSLPFSEGEVTNSEPWKANSPLEQVLAIRQMMIDNGDADLRIWATEYGLPTFGVNGVTEEQQQRYIQDFLTAWAELEDEDGTKFTGPAFLYTLRDAYISGELTEATSLGLFKYDLLTGEWVAKEAAKWLKDFLADPTNPTDPPPTNGGPGNLGEAIAQALQAFINQIQATVALLQQQVEGLINSVNAALTAVVQAIAAIFNPGSAVAPAVAPEVQSAVAEGARSAASALATENVTEDVTEDVTGDVVAARPISDETVEPEGTVEESLEAEEPTESVTVEPTETPESEPEGEEETGAVEGSAAEGESTDEAKEEEESQEEQSGGATDPAVVSDDDADLAEETVTKSRTPDVRVGIVARPAKAGGTDTTDDSTDDSDDTDAPSAENDGDDDSAGASGAESGEG
ncbi:hypothetical protein BHQ18_15845 [Mycolicibacterium flavescens]|uniref:Glycoside hydrolase family 5 domain-containing protein n=1 Tax=Mycolicibacterium flavescens TaxID=1776 RepID=A0A1E3RGR4_MYCFV|nr:hypothetical protein BHQ18_15845 [Mycolicibacterium flavescens]